MVWVVVVWGGVVVNPKKVCAGRGGRTESFQIISLSSHGRRGKKWNSAAAIFGSIGAC